LSSFGKETVLQAYKRGPPTCYNIAYNMYPTMILS